MFYPKSCPYCVGDVQEDSDRYGSFLYCFQCGWQKDLVEGDSDYRQRGARLPINGKDNYEGGL